MEDAESERFWQSGQTGPGSLGPVLRGRDLMTNWGRPLPSDLIMPFGDLESVYLQPEGTRS